MDEHDRALRRELAAMFADELVERIEELNRVTDDLDRSPESVEGRAALHRVLHVIKGAGRAAGEPAIGEACHRLETMLEELADSSALPTVHLHLLSRALDEARVALRAGAPVRADLFERVANASVDASVDAGAPDVSTVEPDPIGAEREDTMRVSASELDALLRQAATALQARQSLTPALRSIEALRDGSRVFDRAHRELSSAIQRVTRTSTSLDEQIRRLRLRPFDEVVAGCAQVVRDAAAHLNKKISLVMQSRGVRLDRIQVESLRDVMIQLVRNAVAHGIEAPEARAAAGKPEQGTITIEAVTRGDTFAIIVRDDGGGLDVVRLDQLAVERGLPPGEARAYASLIFESGVSSAPTVSELSGRGVGLDVVRQRIERLHGTVRVDWEPGVGTWFTIELPVTVATLRSLLVEANGVAYALPIATIERLIWVTPSAMQRGEDKELVAIGDTWVPVAQLATVLGASGSTADHRAPGLVLAQRGRRVVVTVEKILDAVEIAFEPLDPRLGDVRFVAGATTLADSTVALILQAAELVDAVLDRAYADVFRPKQPTKARHTVLLADDSATTRALEANILRSAGYIVRTAVDGEDAWKQLNEVRCDIVVTDVDMPNLSGIELTERIRASPALASVPVILVSSRSTDNDRANGMRAGANAYLTKGGFDQVALLDTLARLL